MKMRSLRPRRPVNYYESEEPPNDAYEFCERCGDFVFEYCSIHGGLLVVPDDKVPWQPECVEVPPAVLTTPGVFLYIASSSIPGAGAGVFAKRALPQGVRFGPYRGQLTEKTISDYCWQMYNARGVASHVVDASDAACSNWMRYVNCARHSSEQNLVAYQYRGQIYFRTSKMIRRHSELLVFYGSEYAVKLNVHLGRYNKNTHQTVDEPKKSSNTAIDLVDTLNTTAEIQRVNAFAMGVIKLDKYFNKEFKLPSDDPEVDIEFNSIFEGVDVGTTTNRQIAHLQWNQVESSTTIEESNGPNYANDDTNATVKDEPIFDLEYKKTGLNNDNSREEFAKSTENVDTNVNSWKCSKCSKVYASRRRLRDHRRTHAGPYEFNCSICSYKTSVRRYFRRHERTMHSQFISEEKSEGKPNAMQLEDVAPWKCEECQKFFINRAHLVNHRLYSANCEDSSNNLKSNSENNIEISPYIHQDSDDKKRVEETVINNANVLKRYENIKAVRCERCDYRCAAQRYLHAHARRVHAQAKLHRCAACAGAFSCAEYLRRHVRRVHLGNKY